MRKRSGFIALIILLVIIIIFAVLAGVLMLSPFQMSTGRYIAADGPFILFDNHSGEPVLMVSPEGRNDMFDALQTGDRILILHTNSMMLSYPAQINAFFCIRLKKGTISDIPEEAIKSLEELGWLQGGTFEQNQ